MLQHTSGRGVNAPCVAKFVMKCMTGAKIAKSAADVVLHDLWLMIGARIAKSAADVARHGL